MKNEFVEMKEVLEKVIKECPWGREQTFDDHLKRLIGEVKELEKAFQEKNFPEVDEELGDVFYDTVFLMLLAEKERGANHKEIIKAVREKIVRRSPHVFGDIKAETREDADKIWNEMKKKEKETGLR